MKLDKEDKSSQSNPISEQIVDDNYKNGFYKNPDFPYLPLMFEGCYEWCSVSRQKWPMPDSLFIDDLDYICVFEIPQYHPTHGNYLWLPTHFADIFFSLLADDRKIAILKYLLALVSYLIFADASTDPGEKEYTYKLLLWGLQPMVSGRKTKRPFRGLLKPPPDITTKEFDLLDSIANAVKESASKELRILSI